MPHIYADILDTVQKPIRYIGAEWNIVRKKWDSVGKHVALAFPDTYELGMSHLGFKILYALLNDRPDIVAERVYTPWVDMEEAMNRTGLPLVTLESQTPLAHFDIVGFSLQYELEYTNILTMLHLGRIPFYSCDRTLENPLVVAGGPCAFCPEPLADFIDCFVIGDGEEAFPRLIDRYGELKKTDLSRQAILQQLAGLPGVYVPALYPVHVDEASGSMVVDTPAPIARAIVPDLTRYPFPGKILVPYTEIVHDRVTLEIARGCNEGCRFCQAGVIYRPMRERNPVEIIDTLLQSLRATGYDGVSLTSLSTADYSCLGPLVQKLMAELVPQKISLALSSMRAYGTAACVLDEVGKVRQTSFTIAPEAGSERLRLVINKGISEEEILESARLAFAKGWRHLKFYFIIGLPTETDADLQALVDLAKKCVDIGKNEFHQRANVTLNAASLVPKPHTPFQWLGMETPAALRRKQSVILDLAKRMRNIDVKYHNVEYSWLEAIFSRGDRRLGKVLESAWRRGCRFDAWGEMLKYNVWCEVLAGVDVDKWLGAIPLSARLPWDHIATGVSPDFLKREYERALRQEYAPACSKPLKNYGEDRMNLGDPGRDTGRPYVCYQCGLKCDVEALRQRRHESWRTVCAWQNGQKTPAPEPVAATAVVPQPSETRYGISYQKMGELRYLSVLDLKRTLTYAFTRAGIPLKFSQGFHPVPAIAYGPALAMGVESEEEWLDFVTTTPIPPATLQEALLHNVPEPLQVTGVYEIPVPAPSLFQAITVGEYAVELRLRSATALAELLPAECAGLPVPAQLQRLVDNLLARPTIMVQVGFQEKQKTQDIRTGIYRIEVAEPTPSLRLFLKIGACGNVRTDSVLGQLFPDGKQVQTVRIVRKHQFIEENGAWHHPGAWLTDARRHARVPDRK